MASIDVQDCPAATVFPCDKCGQTYKHKSSLRKHRRYECGIEPQFGCPYCPHRSKRKQHLQVHVNRQHGEVLLD